METQTVNVGPVTTRVHSADKRRIFRISRTPSIHEDDIDCNLFFQNVPPVPPSGTSRTYQYSLSQPTGLYEPLTKDKYNASLNLQRAKSCYDYQNVNGHDEPHDNTEYKKDAVERRISYKESGYGSGSSADTVDNGLAGGDANQQSISRSASLCTVDEHQEPLSSSDGTVCDSNSNDSSVLSLVYQKPPEERSGGEETKQGPPPLPCFDAMLPSTASLDAPTYQQCSSVTCQCQRLPSFRRLLPSVQCGSVQNAFLGCKQFGDIRSNGQSEGSSLDQDIRDLHPNKTQITPPDCRRSGEIWINGQMETGPGSGADTGGDAHSKTETVQFEDDQGSGRDQPYAPDPGLSDLSQSLTPNVSLGLDQFEDRESNVHNEISAQRPQQSFWQNAPLNCRRFEDAQGSRQNGANAADEDRRDLPANLTENASIACSDREDVLKNERNRTDQGRSHEPDSPTLSDDDCIFGTPSSPEPSAGGLRTSANSGLGSRFQGSALFIIGSSAPFIEDQLANPFRTESLKKASISHKAADSPSADLAHLSSTRAQSLPTVVPGARAPTMPDPPSPGIDTGPKTERELREIFQTYRRKFQNDWIKQTISKSDKPERIPSIIQRILSDSEPGSLSDNSSFSSGGSLCRCISNSQPVDLHPSEDQLPSDYFDQSSNVGAIPYASALLETIVKSVTCSYIGCNDCECVQGRLLLRHVEAYLDRTVVADGKHGSIILQAIAAHSACCDELKCPVPWCQFFYEHDLKFEEQVAALQFAHFSGSISLTSSNSSINKVTGMRRHGSQNNPAHIRWREGVDWHAIARLGTYGNVALAVTSTTDSLNYWVVKKESKNQQTQVSVLQRIRDSRRPHPRLVEHLWTLEQDSHIYIAAKFEGASLAERLGDGLPVSRSLRYIEQLASATNFLQGTLQIAYLNWTVENILLNTSLQNVKLCNFSCAVIMDETYEDEEELEERLEDLKLMLPARIVPPELYEGCSVVPASDTWGLGCVWYQMLTGHMIYPQWRHDDLSTVRDYLEGHPEPDLQHIEDDNVKDILSQCFIMDPGSRISPSDFHQQVALLAQSQHSNT